MKELIYNMVNCPEMKDQLLKENLSLLSFNEKNAVMAALKEEEPTIYYDYWT